MSTLPRCTVAFALTFLVLGCGDDDDRPRETPMEDGGVVRPDGGPEALVLSRTDGCVRRGGSGDASAERNEGTTTSVTTALTRHAPPQPTDRFVAEALVYRLFDTEFDGYSCGGGVAHTLRVFVGPRGGGAPPRTPTGLRDIAVPADPALDDPPDDCGATEVCRGLVEREVALDPPIELAPSEALYAGVVVTAEPVRACAALCNTTSSPQSWTATTRPEITDFNWVSTGAFDLQLRVRGLRIPAPE